MSSVKRWRDTDHLQRAVDTARRAGCLRRRGRQMLDQARGWPLAELRRRREMTQEQVAARMGISVSRASQIENGDVSTQDVLAHYIAALGDTLKLIADFGDEQLKVA
jgi:DNA-binding XRE family transcriptional regulator